MPALLQLDQISCRYDHNTVVDALDLTIQAGEISCLLGPSGCGKTTALRAIAGFQQIVAGRILLNGDQISNPQFTLPPEQRRSVWCFRTMPCSHI